MNAHKYLVPAAALALILIAAVMIAGCTSYSSSPTPAPTTAIPQATVLLTAADTSAMPVGTLPVIATTVSPLVTSTPVASEESIAIKNLAFSPASITVKTGSTVTWTNMDDVPHTVTSTGQSPETLNSPTLGKGETFKFTFTQAGTYSYICTIHTFMKGTVIVTP